MVVEHTAVVVAVRPTDQEPLNEHGPEYAAWLRHRAAGTQGL